jgi:hypothetical protein
MENLFDRVDLFASEVQGFNIEGRKRVSSPVGLVCTFAFVCLMVIYVVVGF